MFHCIALSFVFGLVFVASLAAGQNIHTVNVGWDGSFFTPGTTSAQLNDTVRFLFSGNIHTVTESSFDNPCTPLKGGFDSGPVKEAVGGETPYWDLLITNVSAPIWFFCSVITPLSHCNSGMVGVINPPSIDIYNQFVAAAKTVTGTPQPTPSVHLSGVGAFASFFPTLSSSIPPSSLSSFATSSQPISTSTSSTPSPTVAVASAGKKSNTGAIIGGTIGGILVLITVLMLLFYYLRRKRDESTINDFFQYHTPRSPPTTFNSDKMMTASSSTAGRRALPPAVNYTTPPPPIIRPRRRSWENENPDEDSNRTSVPTYSSETKSSVDGGIHQTLLSKNAPPAQVQPPIHVKHPYMMAGAARSSSDEDVSGNQPVTMSQSHLVSGSQHGHGNSTSNVYGGSHPGHGVSHSATQLHSQTATTNPSSQLHNGNTSHLGNSAADALGMTTSIPRRERDREREMSPPPPVYQPSAGTTPPQTDASS